MRRIQDDNVSAGNLFKARDSGTNTPGTIVRFQWANDMQEERCRGIESTGQAVDETLYIAGDGNRDQSSQAMAHYASGGGYIFDEDATSAADAYVLKKVNFGIRDRQAPTELFEGQRIAFTPADPNTGASTVDVSLLLNEALGTTIINIKNEGGVTDPSAGEIIAGVEIVLKIRSAPALHAELEAPISIDRFIMHVQDQKTSNIDGGTFTSGSYITRTLNAVVNNTISGASLSANQITLPAGTYKIIASAPTYQIESHKTKIYNVTGAADLLIGSTEKNRAGVNVGTLSIVKGVFTLGATSLIELRHRCSSSRNTDGLGFAANFGDLEVYSDVLIEEVG